MTMSTHDKPVETDDRGGQTAGDRGRSDRALVAVMKPADPGDGDDRPGPDRLYLAPARAIVTETLGRPRKIVVREVRAKQATQVAFVEHDEEIEAFAAKRAGDAGPVLPDAAAGGPRTRGLRRRGAGRRAGHQGPARGPRGAEPVVEHVARRPPERKRHKKGPLSERSLEASR
jgi:hypothetical protein